MKNPVVQLEEVAKESGQGRIKEERSVRSPKRIEELDSLRGVAAITVVFSHLRLLWLGNVRFETLPLSTKILRCVLELFSAGHEAVILFFILSGLVLSIPAIMGEPQTYPVFLLRRVFRIYMPYLAALALAVTGDILLHGPVTGNAWFDYQWSSPVTLRLVEQHVGFIGSYDSSQFDPPIWSLIYEMRISLIFPLLCALSLKLKPNQLLAAAACCLGASLAFMLFLPQDSVLGQLNVTLHYVPVFMLGIYLAKQNKVISGIYGCLTKRAKIACLILSAALYLYGGRGGNVVLYRIFHHDMNYLVDGISALGAAGLIVFSVNSTFFRRILLWRPVRVVGKMSYSVYLIHFIIMLVIVHLLHGKMSMPVICIICFIEIIPASWIFYRYVEIPFMTMGRRLSGYL